MARVHFVNVHPGDCTIIEHVSGRVSMIDICDGNNETTNQTRFAEVARNAGAGGNFRMCECNSNPIDYCKKNGIDSIFRFILTHPDMDHMDGLDRLFRERRISNFWHSGARRSKPSFEGGPYLECDWDRYAAIIANRDPSVTVLSHLEGSRFKYANDDEENNNGDGLYILAPNEAMLEDPDPNDDINEASYVILYRSIGGRVLICGDAHDESFEFIKSKHRTSVEGVSVMLAPHHGRDSDRSYDFLDIIKPKLTIIGCAPSQHIDYAQWSRRSLEILTSNQAGNIVLEIQSGIIDVYVENKSFAMKTIREQDLIKNSQGYYGWRRIPKT